MKKYLNHFTLLVLVAFTFSQEGLAQKSKSEFYEVRIYRLKDSTQERRVDAFLKSSFLPALHESGIKNVGVFKPVETDSIFGKRIFVLIPYKSMDEFARISDLISVPKKNNPDEKNYVDAPYDNPPYNRFESVLLRAFTGMPQMEVPGLTNPKSERVYELRSYESATEKLHQNKVQMFNAGDEVGLFKRLGFRAVFYADVITGSRMPNLMYMTTFTNRASRDEHWKSFSDDPQWKKLKDMPEYQHNVSKINIYLLHPAEYSDY